MLGATTWLHNTGARKIYVATPVATQSAIEFVKNGIEGFTSLFVSSNKVFAVSTYYSDFRQLGDRDVRECLRRNREFLKLS
jgi:predicted phosphoribosyltransferase